MKPKLNLAVLNMRKEKMTEKEMNEVRGGNLIACECDPSCYGMPETSYANLSGNSDAVNCPCGSIFVYFGLKWG